MEADAARMAAEMREKIAARYDSTPIRRATSAPTHGELEGREADSPRPSGFIKELQDELVQLRQRCLELERENIHLKIQVSIWKMCAARTSCSPLLFHSWINSRPCSN
jgi:hypothetical protein